MLRIRRISGEELTIALEEALVPNVRALKQHLNQLYDLPPRFRQGLVLHGQCLEDTDALRLGYCLLPRWRLIALGFYTVSILVELNRSFKQARQTVAEAFCHGLGACGVGLHHQPIS